MTAQRQGIRRARRTRDEREELILETAIRLFTEHGVHAVGMDRLIAETGLSKMSLYRLYPTKDELIGAYLERLAIQILGYIDADIDRLLDRPDLALHAILDAIESDLRRPAFRGCPFGNAAGEFDDLEHPARMVARTYRERLLATLTELACRLDPDDGTSLGRRLAVLIDGAYLSAAHLGWSGPASDGMTLARELIEADRAAATSARSDG